eukprot:jgi/Hompol1/255/HPOL_004110-RA
MQPSSAMSNWDDLVSNAFAFTQHPLFRDTLWAATGFLFPEYHATYILNKVVPLKENPGGSVLMMAWKLAWFNIGPWYRYETLFVMLAFIVTEPIRLWLGYYGNLKERASASPYFGNVPDLSGCFLLSFFPQAFTCLYFMYAQEFMGGGFTMPFDSAINFIYLCMICGEVVFGYLAARRIVQSHTILFYHHARLKQKF